MQEESNTFVGLPHLTYAARNWYLRSVQKHTPSKHPAVHENSSNQVLVHKSFFSFRDIFGEILMDSPSSTGDSEITEGKPEFGIALQKYTKAL